MMYAADKYDVVYRMKDSKKKLEVTLHPTTWAELLPRMPKKKSRRGCRIILSKWMKRRR